MKYLRTDSRQEDSYNKEEREVLPNPLDIADNLAEGFSQIYKTFSSPIKKGLEILASKYKN